MRKRLCLVIVLVLAISLSGCLPTWGQLTLEEKQVFANIGGGFSTAAFLVASDASAEEAQRLYETYGLIIEKLENDEGVVETLFDLLLELVDEDDEDAVLIKVLIQDLRKIAILYAGEMEGELPGLPENAKAVIMEVFRGGQEKADLYRKMLE